MSDPNKSPDDLVIQYILIRTDSHGLATKPGLAAAQACHAANSCVFDINVASTENHDFLSEWQDGRGFGTTVTLAVPSGKELYKTIAMAKALGVHAGIVHDDTFPIFDGAVTHQAPFDTCAYMLGRKGALAPFLQGYKLFGAE